MHWDRVRVFGVVAACGSVRQASEELGTSASAVSQKVRKLERELGRSLVEPSGRGIILTAAGSVLARHARSVEWQLRRADDEMDHLTDTVAGKLRIGGVLSAIRPLLGPALAALGESHPRVEPMIVDGEAPEFIELMSTRKLDVAILETWASNAFPRLSTLSSEPILQEHVDLAVPASIGPPPATLAEAAALPLPWVVCPAGSGAYQTVTDLLRHIGRDPEIHHQIASYPSQLDLVACGLAIALVPRLARTGADRPDVTFVELQSPLRRRLHLITRVGDHRPLVTEFRDHLMRRRDLI